VAHLHNTKLKASTIRSVVSAITFKYQSKSLTPPTGTFKVSKLLAAYDRTDPKKKPRKPITKSILHSIIKVAPQVIQNKYQLMLYRSLFSIMYAALLRVGEVSDTKKSKHNLRFHHIGVRGTAPSTYLLISMKSFKFSKGTSKRMSLQQNILDPSICPVRLISKFITRRAKSEFFFSQSNGKPITPKMVRSMLRLILDKANIRRVDFNTHSFRIGRATDMFKEGYTDLQISAAGRWTSQAFMTYIKPQIIALA